MPPAIPLKTPVPVIMVATDVLELNQLPPELASVKVIVAPKHTVDGPPIAATPPVTINVAVAEAEPQALVTV